ncbi:MAG: AAA family ATPase [Bauldia sp.]|uniref:bifunctional aminoglycoside phosphotransferase/ATP-binding protein n=1 Tax=Bauldia sp. TaxID=2575872 RepID=UPI001D3C9A59|nr:bifunctional aminoglycoside phosphotransferase/ATP-binding protein [Bauldia sp.]MCB1495466.1 AAA family ATPase [Bauldia sp.]
MGDDQDAVFAFLADPATHGLSTPVERIDTNAAAVFLAGPDVYKVKRAVRFPFMDLSTLEKRHAACEAEITVNRPYAPDLYLGTVPISRGADGALRFGGNEPIEWAVHLKRFDETRTLDRVAGRDGLSPAILGDLAWAVVDSHARAEKRDGVVATDDLGSVVAETVSSLIERREVFEPAKAKALAEAMRSAFAALRPLLLDRGAEGFVRRCHGDLHLRNIAMIDDKPVLFDAIEFDESIATIDILYDFAFLLMDLWERDLRREANVVLNRYLWRSATLPDDLRGLAALPLFLALRAAVRAKVEALRFATVGHDRNAGLDAHRYFDFAQAFLEPAQTRLIAVGGYSGTGKTSLSRSVASHVGRAPGAVHLRSDIERKRLMGAGELDRLPPSGYEPEVTEKVFAALRDQAEMALTAGHSVIVDAVHKTPDERRLIAAVAERLGVPFTGLWLTAPVEVLIGRIAHRRADASDATAAVVMLQADQPSGEIDWTTLDTTRPIRDNTAAALRAARLPPEPVNTPRQAGSAASRE